MIFFLLALLSLSSFAQENFSCRANYDALGIPHQETRSEEEFYYCFGFHHGSDRAWEMDYFRRVAQGRNAEVLGMAHLKNDLMMRLVNLPAVAEKIWSQFLPEQKRLLELYADGANAGMRTGRNNHEFDDLGYQPEEWRPLDSLTVLLIQSFDQTRQTFFFDYLEERAREHWGEKVQALFEEDGVPWMETILKEGEYPKRSSPHQSVHYDARNPKLWAHFPEVFGKNSGSNNWVVSKRNSKSGTALLANDPHLDLKTPLFWYWIHLTAPGQEVIGASLPGAPVIASGTNGKVSWGLTNAYINTADAIFVKDIAPDKLESIRPIVWFKLGPFKLPFFFKSFERLKTGQPVLPLEVKNKEKLLLRWTGFGLKPEDIAPMFEMIKVQNVDEMEAVLKRVGIPAWNFVFADTKGDIGYRQVGRAYRHEHKLPFGIPMMKLDEFLQEELLTPEERPHVLKPKRDYVYTANNRHWPKDAKFYGGRGYSDPFRGFRINELLEGRKHDVETFQSIQCDNLVMDARFFVPKILKHLQNESLAKWSMLATDDSRELPLFRRLMDIMMEEWKVNEYALWRLLDDLDEKQKKELERFHKRAVDDVKNRSWSEFHRLGFYHLSRNEKWVFSPEMPGVGDLHTVNPGTADWNQDKRIYQQKSGASMRMIIEMKERPIIHLALPGLNRDYTTRGDAIPWEDWRNCRYSQVSF